MIIYKFKDSIDGNYAFIIAKTLSKAEQKLKSETSISFDFIGSRNIEDLSESIIIKNDIAPF